MRAAARLAAILFGLASAAAAAAPAPAPPARPAPAADPGGLFDRLFGAEPERPDAGPGPGRDSLSIVALVLGRTTLNPSLPAFDTADGLCLHATDLLDSLELAHRPQGDGLEVQLFDPPRRVPIPAAELQQTPSGRCVTLAGLARALPARFRHDRENLRVLVEPTEPIPVARRLERAARRAQIAKAPPAGPVLPLLPNPVARLSAPTLDVAAGIGVQAGRTTTALALEATGDLLGLSARLRTGLDADGAPTVRATLAREGLEPELLGPLRARGVQMGDVAAPAQPLIADSAAGRGLVLTSRPGWAADLFDRVDISGPLPPGWDAELHRDNRLVAVVERADADGNYRFADVPLRVGANRYVVKLFGPHGEQDEREFVRVIGRELNPENETFYTLGAVEPGVPLVGQAASERGPPAAFATVVRGLGEPLTARVDLRASARAQAASIGLHAAILGGSGSLVAGTGGGGRPPVALRAARRLGPADLALTLADHGDRAAADAPTDLRETRRLFALDAAGRLPLGRRSIQARATLGLARQRSGLELTRLETGLGFAFGAARLSNRLAAERRRGPGVADTRVDGSLGATLPIADVRLRAGADYRLAPGARLDRLFLAAGRSSARGMVQAEAGWDWAAGTPSASLAAQRHLGAFSLGARAGLAGGGWSAGLTLGFSLYRPSPVGDLPASPGYAFGRPGFSRTAALRPHVFIDADGDGRPGPGDTPVPDARFLVDSSLRAEATDPSGESLIAGLSPGRPIAIEPQLASLPDLSLRPVRPGATAILRAGQVLDVPVPLVPTGEVEVRVLARAGDRDVPLSAVAVRLVGADGQVHQAASDYDGYAYLEGLPFGRYRLEVPSAPGFPPRDLLLDRVNPSVMGMTLLLPPRG